MGIAIALVGFFVVLPIVAVVLNRESSPSHGSTWAPRYKGTYSHHTTTGTRTVHLYDVAKAPVKVSM